MLKNDSMDSTGSSDASACTTQPLDAIMVAPEQQGDDQPLLLDSISFASSSETPQVNIEASIVVERSDVAQC